MLWGGKDVEEFSQAVTSASIASNGWDAYLGNERTTRGSLSGKQSPQDAAKYVENLLGAPESPIRIYDSARLPLRVGQTGFNGFGTFWGIATAAALLTLLHFVNYYDVNATDFIRHINEYHNAFPADMGHRMGMPELRQYHLAGLFVLH
ncbi:hypothetical protein RhiLY_03430 [Ceratobasidium sp. AG-Ba]|nr:hypothetical protein RhiLY_03430 [Ceratobasidium sp. AG-Ba]